MGMLEVMGGHLAFDINTVKHTNVTCFISPFSSVFILKEFRTKSTLSVFQIFQENLFKCCRKHTVLTSKNSWCNSRFSKLKMTELLEKCDAQLAVIFLKLSSRYISLTV